MVRKASEMEKDIRSRMRGGSGEVVINHIFKKDELRGDARLVAQITLESGCSIGLHKHEDEEEIFYITQGTGTVYDNGNITTVSAGDAVLTGGGASHSIENNIGEPLKMVAVILEY